MALTNQQNIPERPKKKQEPWTFRRLFPFTDVVSTFTKVFINTFDVLLGYLIFILGLSELLGRHVTWFLWMITVLILSADLFERHIGISSNTKSETK